VVAAVFSKLGDGRTASRSSTPCSRCDDKTPESAAGMHGYAVHGRGFADGRSARRRSTLTQPRRLVACATKAALSGLTPAGKDQAAG